ncbi:DoxX family membrane protein [Frigidibacter sp. RF13]|uniref:DoxX family membrane protein n=1 Tax=Frigidibacter sp. RF13 TaxID=2997340 RepID=UPI00226E89CB|nr:DoxX family membrane protein [Frigidibacter sp. RF13]MCY1127785.1 DoxX family membrane protein [Frigidibacter sp. RF13]
MNALLSLHDRAARTATRLAPEALPLIARFSFAAVLLVYFWNSARTKLGEGPFGFLSPSDGAYIQIFPKAVEAVGYDVSQLTVFHWAVVTAGTLAELILPALLLLGLFTRLASLGMIGFILVQSLTDIWGHGVGGDDLGRWFDAASGALILDQRLMWVTVLLILAFHGAGRFSLDSLLAGRRIPQIP